MHSNLRLSIDEQERRCVCIYTMECYFLCYSGLPPPQNKNEILPFVTTWMDLEGIMQSEISQIEKDKYCLISLIHGL